MEFNKIDMTKGADTVKNLVKEANVTALKTSDKLVDDTLVAAEKWQGVAEKALKTGTILLEKQSDLMFTVLEGLKVQGMMGTMRLKNLFSLEISDKAKTSALRKKEAKEVAKITKQTIQEVGAKVDEVEKKAKTTIAKMINQSAKKVDETVSKVEKATTKTVKSTKTAVKKEIANAEKKAAAVAKKTTTKKVATKKATPSISAKKTTTKKATVAKDDLKTINGVGPKMESVLKGMGIITFADLAKADAKKLSADLTAINPRYSMFETADWVKEASSK